MEAQELRRAVVVCHRNADADAYLSAYALSFLLRKLSPKCEVDIATPEGMTTLTNKLFSKFPHQTVERSEAEYDLYVAVDVGGTELLHSWKEKMEKSTGVKVLVDHHPLQEESLYDHFVVDERATSAAEVVLGIYQSLGVDPEPKTAQALLEALMFDSSHLAIAGESGLRAAVRLLDSGADLGEAKKDLRSDPDYGEVLAKLKGAQRLKVYKIGEWVAATSLVGSFQAHVARSLVYLGADVAVVGGETEGETRVSLRSTQRFKEKTGLKMGSDIAEAASKSMGGHGGGHATAASFTTLTDEEAAVSRALAKIADALGDSPKELN